MILISKKKKHIMQLYSSDNDNEKTSKNRFFNDQEVLVTFLQYAQSRLIFFIIHFLLMNSFKIL